MQLTAHGKTLPFTQMLRIMKMSALLLILVLQLAARPAATAQVTLKESSASLEKVLKAIKKQSDYGLSFDEILVRTKSRRVVIDVSNVPVDEALAQVFKTQDKLSYSINGKIISVKEKPVTNYSPVIQSNVQPLPPTVNVKGRVINEKGEPLAGVSVVVKGTKRGTSTDDNGSFELKELDEAAVLQFSGVNIEAYETKLNGRTELSIIANAKFSQLDDVVMMAYGQTTRRLNTGNISKVSSTTIEKQPIGNVLSAIQSRVPGLQVEQSSGIPGSAMKVRIRGQGSIAQGSDPLILVDGIPFAPNNDVVSSLNSSAGEPGGSSPGGISPLFSLNPSDIESIEILKDADATAIYGSRGANGVLLITTKKGKIGKTRIKTTVYTGINTSAQLQSLLTTQQYLEMRKEAFANDNLVPNVTNAPDVLIYDQQRDNDFQKQFTNGASRVTDAQLSVSGGTGNSQYLLGAGFRSEKNSIQGNLSNERASVHFRMDHASDDKKFSMTFSVNFSNNSNNLISRDLTEFVTTLPPNMPSLLSPQGDLLWNYQGVNFSLNPFSYTKNRYQGNNQLLLGNLQVTYKFTKDLQFKTGLGYNSLWTNESAISPLSGQNPMSAITGSANFNQGNRKSWIVEPQLEYAHRFKFGSISALVGGSWQQLDDIRSSTNGSGYINDASLYSLSGAATVTATNSANRYKYAALFGRINYSYLDRYIVNLSARRDGSSRFGPGQQFQNFGAIGAAWIFTKELWWKNLNAIGFGKIRMSYGITGNDQIGNYKYLDSWSNTRYPYQGIAGLTPTRLSNPDYQWETNRKWELGLDLSFLNERLITSIAYYMHQSGNQLIDYRLPTQTGFSSIFKNFPATVSNTGIEGSVSLKTIQKKSFNWTSELNFSIARNKLQSFPGIESSSYATTLEVGKSLSVLRGYIYVGVNPSTGVYDFVDRDKNGLLNSADYSFFGNLDPQFSAGLVNSLQCGQFSFEIFADYVKQTGPNYLRQQAERSFIPGLAFNQPVGVMDRWRKPGDISHVQRFTASTSSSAYAAQLRLFSSDGGWTDASFFRIKNISLDYQLPEKILQKWKMGYCKFYLQVQNAFTFTRYDGGDPTLRDMYVLPTQRSFVAGISLSTK